MKQYAFGRRQKRPGFGHVHQRPLLRAGMRGSAKNGKGHTNCTSPRGNCRHYCHSRSVSRRACDASHSKFPPREAMRPFAPGFEKVCSLKKSSHVPREQSPKVPDQLQSLPRLRLSKQYCSARTWETGGRAGRDVAVKAESIQPENVAFYAISCCGLLSTTVNRRKSLISLST